MRHFCLYSKLENVTTWICVISQAGHSESGAKFNFGFADLSFKEPSASTWVGPRGRG